MLRRGLRFLNVHPTGRYVWAFKAGQVKSFSLNPVDGTLDYLSEYNIGGFDAALETTGRFLYVTAEVVVQNPPPYWIREIRILRFNPLTGEVDGESVGANAGEYSFSLEVSGPIRSSSFSFRCRTIPQRAFRAATGQRLDRSTENLPLSSPCQDRP